MLHLQDPQGTVRKEMCGRCTDLREMRCNYSTSRSDLKSLFMLLMVSYLEAKGSFKLSFVPMREQNKLWTCMTCVFTYWNTVRFCSGCSSGKPNVLCHFSVINDFLSAQQHTEHKYECGSAHRAEKQEGNKLSRTAILPAACSQNSFGSKPEWIWVSWWKSSVK